MIKKLFWILCCLMLVCSVESMADILYPPEEHPYIYVNDEYIAQVKSKKNIDETYICLLKGALKELPSLPDDNIISAEISRQLEVRAFMYAMGEVDANHAKETVDFAIEYLTSPKTSKTYSIDVYKDYGENAIMTGALIYDWCHGAMNEGQKSKLSKCVYDILYLKDSNGNYIQPCRANNTGNWSDIAGKAVGQPLIYNSIAASALYDVYPELYEAMMPKIQGSMADVVRFYGSVGGLSDGSIAYGREYYAYYVSRLFERMGYPEFYGNQLNVGYKYLYSRLPYGAYIKQGDDPKQRDYILGRYTNGAETSETMAILSSVYNDPYLKFQYVKENDGSDLFDFLLKESDTDAKLPDSLPLSFYVSEPGSEILARTSWVDGITSPAAVGYMNMNNRRTGDHDHAHIGNFQLYYKGPLTMPSGIYTSEYWGGKHWAGYYSRTISANCITVYDESEDFTFGTFNINDGGQKIVPSPLYKYSDHMADENKRATEEGHYIGPNKNTPAFSYIKGDLTNAYSDKVTSYKRSMVFMDLFSDTYPAAMIVYDKISSSNAEFPKKWLLQAVAEPQVSGDKIIISNAKGGGGGKLVNTVLYPQDAHIGTVGGVGEFMVNSEEVPADKDCSASPLYKSGYRCEVSPVTSAKDDIFLNAMYVTDAGTTEVLPTEKVETAEFIGATMHDRMVLFSKSGKQVENTFEISINNNSFEEINCLITDVKAGKWSIAALSGEKIIVNSLEGENVLCFKAGAGEYTLSPASSSENVTLQNFPEVTKQKTGDFVIKCDNGYINPVKETMLIGEVPYASVLVLEEMGATICEQNGGYYATKGDKTLFIGGDTESFVLCGTKIPLENSLKTIDGDLYIPICEFSPFVGYRMEYKSESLKLECDSFTKSVNMSGDIIPAEITSPGGALLLDGYIVDSFLVPDENNAIIYDLGNVYKINSIKMFCQENYDKIKIYASIDGVKYFDVLPKITTENGLRIFKSDFVAKYIKVFSTENVNVREIRVFGSNFENECEIIGVDAENYCRNTFLGDYIKNFAADEKLLITAFINNNATSASVYLDDILLGEITLTEKEIYHISYNIPGNVSGNKKLRLVCDGNESIRDIFISEGSEYTNILSADFEDNQLGGELEFTSNNTGKLSFENGTAKVFLASTVDSSEPFIMKRGFLIDGGKIKLDFDISFSSPGCKLLLELRDGDGKVPYSGAYYTICSGGKIFGKTITANTVYKICVEIDTANALMRVYVGGELAGMERLRCDGISQIRFCFRSGLSGTSFMLDNVNMYIKEMTNFNRFIDISAEKSGNEVIFTINSDTHKAGKVKYIKVIKKDDKIFDVDIISPDLEEEKTQVIRLPGDGYSAELYVTSYYNLFDFMKGIKP